MTAGVRSASVTYGTASFFIIAAANLLALPGFPELRCFLFQLLKLILQVISDVRQFLDANTSSSYGVSPSRAMSGNANFLKSHERGSNDVGATNVNIVIRRLQANS